MCRITKFDLGTEMDVAELTNTCNNEHKRKKKYPLVPVDFCLRTLRTKLSRKFLLRLKEIRGLSVKMADV